MSDKFDKENGLKFYWNPEDWNGTKAYKFNRNKKKVVTTLLNSIFVLESAKFF